MSPEQDLSLYRVLTPEEEKSWRKWARDNWEYSTDINPLWHPVVRAECAQMQVEYPALLAVERDKQLAAGFDKRAVDAIIGAWPEQAVAIFRQWKHDTLNGCYGFSRWGMYVGVEYDGYIHT